MNIKYKNEKEIIEFFRKCILEFDDNDDNFCRFDILEGFRDIKKYLINNYIHSNSQDNNRPFGIDDLFNHMNEILEVIFSEDCNFKGPKTLILKFIEIEYDFTEFIMKWYKNKIISL